MSYTQYLHRKETDDFVATPNGIAIEMLHSMRGDRLETQVGQLEWKDKDFCAIAVKEEGGYAVLTTNPTTESMPLFLEFSGLADGQYRVEVYGCNLVSNNIVYKNGKGTGKLTMTQEAFVTAENGVLKLQELYDKDCFSLTRIIPV